MSSTNRGAQRAASDYYPTPPEAVWSLLRRVGSDLNEHNYGRWLEPAVGTGAIIKAVQEKKRLLRWEPMWDALDINLTEETISELRSDVDSSMRFAKQNYLLFSLEDKPDSGDPYEVILTNPPFFIAQDFVEHSLDIANGAVVIMLLRLGFLGSKKRAEWWQGKEPDALYVLSDRPDFTGEGGDSSDYAWYFWNWHHKGIFILPPWRDS